ncbi:TetR/AcrR family transcriptional regulator [Nocardiopsis sp. L17-MgMaSL7]|uniref:TetR/AcrR family transcriptional regulator n=1 Tax=Nocardiopsis sp. L17-MgMaSL7 TaxID=1938893 RepID=UPI000D7158D1|nr:TetR/AcrR family transcriptional regulator [Nocardiopsis sp. L17-MgMaSL7]PWV52773.1 TetR family transcriptional regulator [Nocardiopsis sp. L17-MgMaSL7]
MRTVNPEKHAARRASILGAAAEVFAERGYDGATTAAICKRAGVGSGTLFHYFPDKRTVFLAIVTDDLAAVTTRLERIDRTDPARALDEVLDLLTADLGDPIAPGLAAAMIQLAQRDPEFGATVVAKDEGTRAALAGIIGAGRGSGVFEAAVDPHRAARWIVALTDAGYLISDNEEFDPAEDGAELRRIIAAYLGRRTGTA